MRKESHRKETKRKEKENKKGKTGRETEKLRKL
jgi:hypothetical protein